MAKTEELKQYYDYLKEAANALEKATNIRVNASLIVIREKLYEEMSVVLDEREEAVKIALIEKYGSEEAERIIKKYEEAK